VTVPTFGLTHGRQTISMPWCKRHKPAPKTKKTKKQKNKKPKKKGTLFKYPPKKRMCHTLTFCKWLKELSPLML
jgi:hypothetical protein